MDPKRARSAVREIYYNYIYAKLQDPETTSRAYRKITKILRGENLESQIPLLMYSNRIYCADVEKTNLLNELVAKQSNIIATA